MIDRSELTIMMSGAFVIFLSLFVFHEQLGLGELSDIMKAFSLFAYFIPISWYFMNDDERGRKK